MNITRYLAAAIRANDLPAYQRERSISRRVRLFGLLMKIFLVLILISLSWDFSRLKIAIWIMQSIFTGSRFILQFVGSGCGFSRCQSYY